MLDITQPIRSDEHDVSFVCPELEFKACAVEISIGHLAMRPEGGRVRIMGWNVELAAATS